MITKKSFNFEVKSSEIEELAVDFMISFGVREEYYFNEETGGYEKNIMEIFESLYKDKYDDLLLSVVYVWCESTNAFQDSVLLEVARKRKGLNMPASDLSTGQIKYLQKWMHETYIEPEIKRIGISLRK